jgi:AraC family L-rhamnose operon regulatory protein RhaS
MATPVSFQDEDKVIYADSCTPLSTAAKRGEVDLAAWGRGAYPGIRLPQDNLLAVRSLGVWDATRPQSWGLDTHCNEGLEFTYLARGRLPFQVNEQWWNLHKGQMTITRPWQFHRVGRPHVTPSRLVWLILDVRVRRPNQPWQWPSWVLLPPEDRQQLTDLLSQNEQPVWPANEAVADAFARLADLLGKEDPAANEARLKLHVNELLIAVNELLQAQHIALDAYLTTSQRAVELFLAALPRRVEQAWDLEGMAAACGLSRSQFSTYCKQITNMTPIEYLRHCRMQAAVKQLERDPEAPITQIAFDCGFNSSQYFASVFRDHFGCAPTDYREALENGGGNGNLTLANGW